MCGLPQKTDELCYAVLRDTDVGLFGGVLDSIIKDFPIITGPPTYGVGARLVTLAGVCRRLSSSTVCRRRL